MKRFSCISVMLAMVLTLGLVLVSCDNDTTSNTTKFEGTWVSGNMQYRYTFTGNSFTLVYDVGRTTGSFSFTESVISFTATDGSTYVTSYSISGTTLTLLSGVTTGAAQWYYGTWTKF